MRLGLQVYPKTLDQYLRDLGNIVSDTNTQVYLDTNILGYLYKLHPEARKEFFGWTSELELTEGRIFIPAWSANEYLAKFKAGKFSEYSPSRPEQVVKLLNNLRETASLFVDEAGIKKVGYSGTRTDFLNDFDNAIKELSKFTCIFNQQFDTWSVHSEITNNLTNCILYSDLAALCLRAANEGDVRISHRLPPGFKDSTKTENKYGDLIIWYEILEHLKTLNERLSKDKTQWNVIFVSNDEKPDWVYAPQKRLEEIKGVIKEIKNADPEIKIPDPRLSAEFRTFVGHENFHITTLPMLIRALSAIRPKDFEYLASAIQIESGNRPVQSVSEVATEDTQPISEEISEKVSVIDTQVAEVIHALQPENQAQVVSNEGIGFVYPNDALRDGAYECDAPGEINEIIRALRSQNWYTQNPAILKIKEIRQAEFEPGQWFVLGRNIYQAACGNAQKALELLKNLDIELSRFPTSTANHLLCGMIYEVYFDHDGCFRNHPKAAHIEQTMREISGSQYEQIRNTLLTQLAPYRQWVPFMPGELQPLILDIGIEEIGVEVNGAVEKKYIIQSVKFLGAERLLVPPTGEGLDIWSNLLGPSKTTARKIKSNLSDNYAIPEWAIQIQLNDPEYIRDTLRIPEGKILKLERPPYPA